MKTTIRNYFKMIWLKIRLKLKVCRTSFWIIIFKVMAFMQEELEQSCEFKPNNPIDQFEGDIDFGVYEFEYCIEFTTLLRDTILANSQYPVTKISIAFNADKAAPLHKIIYEYCLKKCGLKLSSCETVLDEVVFTIVII